MLERKADSIEPLLVVVMSEEWLPVVAVVVMSEEWLELAAVVAEAFPNQVELALAVVLEVSVLWIYRCKSQLPVVLARAYLKAMARRVLALQMGWLPEVTAPQN